MKDLDAVEPLSNEAFWLFKQLNLHLEQEWKFQPREKGLSLIERTAEVRRKEASFSGLGDGVLQSGNSESWL